MGLIFPLQVDTRKTKSDQLVLKSTAKRFGVGGSLIFGAVFLGTLFHAASPLFKVLWEEGNLFDKSLTAFFYAPIVLYPIAALGCWFFQEKVVVTKASPTQVFPLNYEAFDSLFGIRWGRRSGQIDSIEQLQVVNFQESRNMAAIESEKKGNSDRYSTKGHWKLVVIDAKDGSQKSLERRAKIEDIQYLKAVFQSFINGTKIL